MFSWLSRLFERFDDALEWADDSMFDEALSWVEEPEPLELPAAGV
jgi:hypothetical protein